MNTSESMSENFFGFQRYCSVLHWFNKLFFAAFGLRNINNHKPTCSLYLLSISENQATLGSWLYFCSLRLFPLPVVFNLLSSKARSDSMKKWYFMHCFRKLIFLVHWSPYGKQKSQWPLSGMLLRDDSTGWDRNTGSRQPGAAWPLWLWRVKSWLDSQLWPPSGWGCMGFGQCDKEQNIRCSL